MIRYLRYLFIAVLAICLIVLALANSQTITLHLLPDAVKEVVVGYLPIPMQVDVPLYVAIFAGIAIGVLVGFVWEWFREMKHRSVASKRTREAQSLAREVVRLKEEKNEGKDDVLALLDDAPRKAG